METEPIFVSEMDEMMVQDAGIVSEGHEELVQDEMSVSAQFNITLPSNGVVGKKTDDPDDPAISDLEEPKSVEIAQPTPRRGGKKAGPAKAPVKVKSTRASPRRGRSAGIITPKKEEEEDDRAVRADSEEIQLIPAVPATKPAQKSPPVRVRSSGRNSRKKIDPDFCYDETVAFAGGRKPRGGGGGGDGGALDVPSSSLDSVAPSKALEAQTSTTSNAVVANVRPPPSAVSTATAEGLIVVDSFAYPLAESPSSSSKAALAADDEAKVASGSAAGASLVVADDVIAPAVDVVQSEKDEKPGKPTPARPRRRSKSELGHAADGTAHQPKLYCICQKPYDKRFMISCDTCEEWFHGTCVGVTKKQGEKYEREKIKWLCPNCKAAGGDETGSSTAADLSTSLELPIDEKASKAAEIAAAADDPDFVVGAEGKPKKGKKNVAAKKKGDGEKKMGASGGAAAPTPLKEKIDASKRIPSPRKMSDAKETTKERPISDAKPKEIKPKHPKVEEKPPIEADSSCLVLTALGKPAAAGSRTLRHTHLSRSARPPPLTKTDNLFDSPKPARPSLLTSPLPKPAGQKSATDAKTPTTPSHLTSSSPFSKTESPKPAPPAKPHPAAKLKPCICMVCKKIPGRENSLFCSTDCVMRHANDALELVKSSPNTPADRMAVTDKQTGQELTGQDAPLRMSFRAWLESHQTCCVHIPSMLLQARANKAGPDVELDAVRASTRLMLKEHLLTRWKEALDLHKDHMEESLADVATKIEIGLYKKFKDTNQEYKKKYRVIVLNIDDKKNENFFRRLIKQEIPPGDVADLSQEQMASDSLTQWRQEIERKELDLIIQTQLEEHLDQRPVIKKTHRGDEFFGDEIAEEVETRPEQQPNMEIRRLADPAAADNDSNVDHANFSPAVVLSPGESMRSPAYSFSGPITKISPAATPSSSSQSSTVRSPDQLHFPSPGQVSDAADEIMKAEHKSHVFEIGCKYCNGSFAAGPNVRKDSLSEHSPKSEAVPPRRLAIESSSAVYSSPTGTSFKVPVGGSPSGGHERKRKLAKMEETADSPVSSTSEYSPESEDAIPAGVIWQGTVDTKDLPAARLQAFALYGKAAEFMTELPERLDQLGRIQPAQLWPYLEQVKPLKDLAVVILKSPPGRVSSEFNSLHYFLTTRGRVSVLGPLPSSFKDFYMIALKENEALPESVVFPDNADFESEHGKIFLGIIVHHRVNRQPAASVGRGIFDVPVTATANRKLSPYPSPDNPTTPTDAPAAVPRTRKSHDPIVNRFLDMEVAPPAATIPPASTAAVAASPDTSEPMDIDDDTPQDAKTTETPAKLTETSKSADVKVSDLLKLVKTLPSKTQAALGLGPSAKPQVAPPVDPRRNRLSQLSPVEAEPAKAPPIQINHAATKPPSPVAVATTSVPLLPTPEAVIPATTESDVDSSFGFSKKFIENLAKIEFPEGLKEALRSIQPQPAPQPAELPKPSLLGTPPNFSVPPPNFTPVRPNYNVPPPNLLPGGGYPPSPVRFSPRLPPPGFQDVHPSFGDRPPPRGFPAAQSERWNPPSDQQRGNYPPDRGNQYSEFRGGPPPPDRWGDRPERNNNVRGDNRRRSPSPPRNRDRRDSDRGRPAFGGRNQRDDRGNSDRDVAGHRGGDGGRRNEDRPVRRRSRSRSPVRPRREDRDRRRGSRERVSDRSGGGGRKRDSEAATSGVDEFGRDITLRRQVSKSESRDRELSADKSGNGGRRGSDVDRKTKRVSLDRLSEEPRVAPVEGVESAAPPAIETSQTVSAQ